ncbi:hypothetical protein CBM2585_A200080 [Cupriavidus taiwanensis]|nr:hypothetical protein CBM2585_A200080 [Cupriavidus taiwanensis]
MPSASAMVVTTSKYTTALMPTRPTFFSSPAPQMPATTTQNTIGPISILISLIKASPSGLSLAANSGNARPSAVPITRAISTWPNSERVKRVCRRGVPGRCCEGTACCMVVSVRGRSGASALAGPFRSRNHRRPRTALTAGVDCRPYVPGSSPGSGARHRADSPPVGADSTPSVVRTGLSAADCLNVEANIVHIIFVCNF